MDPTLLIGLDGATFTVLDPLVAEGHLPNLARIIAGGVRAPLRTTPHPLTPPAWTTLMTGRGPGSHGIFDFLRSELRSGGAYFTLNNFRDIRTETIWTIVSRLGGRVISLNFPLMAPPPAVNGAIVPGLLSFRHLRRNVFPLELYDELKALDGFSSQALSWDFEHEKKALQLIPEEELEPWVSFHIEREKQWFSILEHLMRTRPADLTAVMFDGVDKLQHGCWRFLDPAWFPAQPNAFERKMRDLCVQYFRELDGFIGRIVEQAPANSRVFLASDHGFGPTTKVLRINKWLEQLGHLHWQSDAAAAGGPRTGAHYVALDWQTTKAYAPSAATNGIHIRVEQQPGDGGVPRAEYDSFRQRLVDELLELRDPEDGTLLVKEVLLREQAFPGRELGNGPDLTLVMCDHGFVSVLDAEPVIWTRPIVAGTHYPEGVLLASGPGIRAGDTLAEQSILDVAATLLYSLGEAIPSDFESRVMRDVFTPEFLAERPVRSGTATLSVVGESAAEQSSDEEDADAEEKIMERLRQLGYVE